MKKSNAKRLAAVLAAITMCGGMACTTALTAMAKAPAESGSIVPWNIAITKTSCYLERVSSSQVSGYATCLVPSTSNYTTGITVELQQLNGSWKTIKTWTATGDTSVSLEKTYFVLPDYSYRFKVTNKAYYSNGSLIESIVKYSTVV